MINLKASKTIDANKRLLVMSIATRPVILDAGDGDTKISFRIQSLFRKSAPGL